MKTVSERTNRMIHEQLPAVITKIARMLAVKPEYFVAHPSELGIVQALSDSELRDLALAHGWRFVRRVGGRRVEFYNDARAAYRPM
jgi:hypothetical protein